MIYPVYRIRMTRDYTEIKSLSNGEIIDLTDLFIWVTSGINPHHLIVTKLIITPKFTEIVCMPAKGKVKHSMKRLQVWHFKKTPFGVFPHCYSTHETIMKYGIFVPYITPIDPENPAPDLITLSRDGNELIMEVSLSKDKKFIHALHNVYDETQLFLNYCKDTGYSLFEIYNSLPSSDTLYLYRQYFDKHERFKYWLAKRDYLIVVDNAIIDPVTNKVHQYKGERFRVIHGKEDKSFVIDYLYNTVYLVDIFPFKWGSMTKPKGVAEFPVVKLIDEIDPNYWKYVVASFASFNRPYSNTIDEKILRLFLKNKVENVYYRLMGVYEDENNVLQPVEFIFGEVADVATFCFYGKRYGANEKDQIDINSIFGKDIPIIYSDEKYTLVAPVYGFPVLFDKEHEDVLFGWSAIITFVENNPFVFLSLTPHSSIPAFITDYLSYMLGYGISRPEYENIDKYIYGKCIGDNIPLSSNFALIKKWYIPYATDEKSIIQLAEEYLEKDSEKAHIKRVLDMQKEVYRS